MSALWQAGLMEYQIEYPNSMGCTAPERLVSCLVQLFCC